ASGTRGLKLLKALYVVQIDPPLNSPYASTTTTLDLSKVGPTYTPDEQIILTLRIAVDGTIRSDLGRPVPLASLEFRPIIGTGRSVEARTDAAGAFTASLEPGAYFLIVSPRGAT